MSEYKSVAGEETGRGIARSKKEAKQEAARAALARRGHAADVPHEELPWRPDDLKISEYHLGLVKQVGAEKAAAGLAALNAPGEVSERVQCAASAMGLRVEMAESVGLATLALAPTTPPLLFAGISAESAAAAALRYLLLALEFAPAPTTT